MHLAVNNGLTRVVLRLLGMGLAVAATTAAVVTLQARAQNASAPSITASVAGGPFREVTIVDNKLENRARLKVDATAAGVNGAVPDASVGQVLLALGFVLDKPDVTYPALSSPTPWYGRIYIQRAPGVFLKFDGKLRDLKTGASTVEQLLAEQKVILDEDDRVEPAKQTAIAANMTIEVIRIETKETTEQETIGFETQTQDDSSRYSGDEAVKVAGADGVKEKKYKLTLENGKEVKRDLVLEKVIKEPVTKIVLVGTKARPAPSKTVTSGPVVGPFADIVMDAAKKYGQDAHELMRVMLCESGGYRWADNGGGNLGLFQFSRGTWSQSWNSYRSSDIFSTDQIYAAAQAWSLGMRGRWGC
ncbi:MAG: G5 domain-containing protein [Parcubacteria group bacterium]